MSSFVVLTLDTTPPSLEASLVEVGQDATLSLVTDDAIEVRIWGDIDVTWPGNADFAESEQDAVWIPYSDTFTVRLDPGGAKRLRVRARDSVWNETAALLLVGTPAQTERPGRPAPIRTPAKPRKFRSIETESALALSTQYSVQAAATEMLPLTFEEIESIAVQMRDDSVLATAVEALILARVVHGNDVALTAESTVTRRNEGPGTEAALVALDLL